MVRKYQVIHNQVIPKVHRNGVSSCALHQYDPNDSATNKLHYHYQLCIFWFQHYEYVYHYYRDSTKIDHSSGVHDHIRYYSFKSENNGCSVYMSNIFYGHAPLMSGLFLLNLDSSDTHIHSIEAKRYKFNSDSATYLWHCRLGHIGVKRMKKLHAD